MAEVDATISSCTKRRRSPSKKDAARYMAKVSARFLEQPDIIIDFLNAIRAYKGGQVTVEFVMHRVATLFAGHIDLIVAFDMFLPVGYSMIALITEQIAAMSAGGGVSTATCLTSAAKVKIAKQAVLSGRRRFSAAALKLPVKNGVPRPKAPGVATMSTASGNSDAAVGDVTSAKSHIAALLPRGAARLSPGPIAAVSMMTFEAAHGVA